MELPALLPQELTYTSVATTDKILLHMLEKIPHDFIIFFEYACADETWSGNHHEFMRNAIQWLTQQFFQDQLLMVFAQKAAQAIREHIHNLESAIYNNLTINYGSGNSTSVSSLLWGSSSEYLRTLIRREGRDRGK